MKVPLSWLKEFLPLHNSPQEIASTLTNLGLEVEKIDFSAPAFEGVVVGYVEKVERHPAAERLQIACVSDGAELFQVVCGAPNCRAGIKTAFAKIGALLPDGKDKPFKIKKSKLRGVESYGMLCSGAELQLSQEDEGILELDQSLPLGKDLKGLFSDAVFDIALTPNLNHCSSILGVARELAAYTKIPLAMPPCLLPDHAGGCFDLRIENRAKEDCPLYYARMIKGVKIGPSPEWMKARLQACGIKSINNVVDCTNYVLLELGHPLHAFDAHSIAGNKIVIRHAKEGEKIETLDQQTRSLFSKDLLICDQEKPLALAGIMGGKASQVTSSTIDILLEGACFSAAAIRRCAKKQGLMTESSRRFERGCDPGQPAHSLNRAIHLILQLAGGELQKEVVESVEKTYPLRQVSLSLEKINSFLGTAFSLSEVENLLQRLSFATKAEQSQILVNIPSYRRDVHGFADLCEEIARLHGYENIPRKKVRYRPSPVMDSALYTFENLLRQKLTREGLQEIITCDLIGDKEEILLSPAFPGERLSRVVNPSNNAYCLLRPSFLPNFLNVVKRNQDQQIRDVRFFEIGAIYSGDLPQKAFGVLLSGLMQPPNWHEKPVEATFYHLKGLLENLCQTLRLQKFEFAPSGHTSLHPGRQSSLQSGGMTIGTLGEVHPSVLRRAGIDNRVLFAELSLADLQSAKKRDKAMHDIPIYPSSSRDWTLTLAEEVPMREVFSAIHAFESYLLHDWTLTALFRSEKIGPGRKNATLHFVYRDPNRTLSLEEIEKEHARLVQGVLEKLQPSGKVFLT